MTISYYVSLVLHSKCLDCKFITLPQQKWNWKNISLSEPPLRSLFPSPLPAIHLSPVSCPPLTSSDPPLPLLGMYEAACFVLVGQGWNRSQQDWEPHEQTSCTVWPQERTVHVLGVNLLYRLVVQGSFSPRDSTGAKTQLAWLGGWFPIDFVSSAL